MTSRRVIDCTMYAYEPSALEVRLTELAGVVDAVHIVSGDHTYRGHPQTIDRDWNRTGVTHRIVTLPAWTDVQEKVGLTTVERIQRDLSLSLAAELHDDPDALFLLSDGDEIPHPDAVRQAVDEYDTHGPRVLLNDARCWYADWTAAPNGFPPRHHLNQPIIGTYADYLAVGGAQNARMARGFKPTTGRPWRTCDAVGWHLSDLDGPAMVSDKFGKFSHAEDDNPHDRDLARLTDTMRRRVWPKHEWPLTHTRDVPACVPTRFPHLLGGE